MRRGGLSSQNNEDNNEKEDKSGVKTKRGNKPWLFLLCAWACYMRYVSTTTVSNEKTTTSPVDMNSFINVIETPENPQSESIPSVVENVGLTIALSEEEEEIEKESKKKEEKTKSLQVGDNSEEHQVGERDDDIDDGKGGTNLPMIGATMALSGKCTSPDYGTKLFYIKTKHVTHKNTHPFLFYHIHPSLSIVFYVFFVFLSFYILSFYIKRLAVVN
mmetsp:Transcript_20890/g.27159  ORF Transcript_20890/g.27159 Transcript_20890/m.27159 type:complete len:217 (+) Transcript_20890:62-712(+)